MNRYLKLVSWSCLITGLIVITLIIISLWFWQNQQTNQSLNQPAVIIVTPPSTESRFISDTPIVGLIDKINGDTLWVSRFGQQYEIKIDPRTNMVKTAQPIPIAPNSTTKKAAPQKTAVNAQYLKVGQKIKIIPQVISSSQPIILATALEIWE